ncbi:unnamed protein product [Penicillium viridicatum]
MDIGNNDRVTDHRHYYGTDPESMEALELHLSSVELDSEDRPPSRIICAQHITCLSMEALGSGLSLDPNVFSHHIGTSFKDIEKSTGTHKLCNTKIERIPSAVGTSEHEKNLQILKSHLGRLSIANSSGSIHHISVDVPRTIYVQGYQSEDDRTQPTGRGLRARVLALQDRVLNRRIARKRFVDDSMFCDQGEQYSQNGLDILQRITIHVTKDSLNPECQQLLVLFPPCPELDGEGTDNDPHVFLDPLTKQENIKSFKRFRLNRDEKDHKSTKAPTASRRTMSQDVEIFAKDILLENEAGAPRKPAEIVHLVRLYALNAWFDRVQTLRDQLEDLSLESLSHQSTQHNEDSEDPEEENHTVDAPINEEGIKGAILRYISSLNVECQRLKLDLRAAKLGSTTDGFDCVRTLDQTMEKYTHIRSQMSNLLSETQHLLDMKNSKIQQTLTTRQIKENREFIEQAATAKRYDTRLSC